MLLFKSRSGYLNAILTVNAVLLAGVLWTHVAGQPLLAQPASAGVSKPTTMPNAAKQRHQLLQAMQQMQQSVEASNQLLRTGHLRVEVTNLSEIKMNADL